MPNVVSRYCPKCGTKTEHEIRQASRGGKRGALKAGQRRRKEKTAQGHGDKGRYSKKPPKDRNRNSKSVKKLDFRYKCKQCGRQTVQKKGKRIKRIEFLK